MAIKKLPAIRLCGSIAGFSLTDSDGELCASSVRSTIEFRRLKQSRPRAPQLFKITARIDGDACDGFYDEEAAEFYADAIIKSFYLSSAGVKKLRDELDKLLGVIQN